MKKPKYPDARYFKFIGRCRECGKPAHGQLMNHRNDYIGTFCTKHGEAHAKAANAAIDREARRGKA